MSAAGSARSAPDAGLGGVEDWYKDAIIYQLHVKAFGDSNGDGIGDFRGLTRRLDYVQELGVNTVWLLPFYPSPLRDDGYDIADYRDVHSDYGTRRDARDFIREAHRRGLRVITELVINHTSDQHPWFQAARRAPPGSPKRAFYVWSDDDRQFAETRIIFTDTETSNWAWDPVAQQYYWHRFFSHQPDLNHNNPKVVDAVIKLMRFWLDLGVDGLRLDAIPYLCVREGTSNENLPETHAVIKRMRAVVDEHYRGRLFLAEANQWPEDVREYFGDGDECHMAYHFPLMPRMYMAVAQEDRHPVVEIMEQTPAIPANCQWAIFLRNHDELTLEMVTDRERDYMYQTYATDPRMRINVGIRRRLAPLMDNDGDKIRLMNSLLMSMPGSPVVYYGDEIGMGDNIYLGDRNGVRTPMQWSPDRNAGFSRADPQKLYLPPIMDPIYGYEAVNVEAQSREPASLLNWMKRLIAVRKAHLAFGRGTLRFLHPGNRKVIAYLREYRDDVILCVANLARTAQPVELELGDYRERVPVELLGRTPFPPVGELPYLLTLPGHAFYWFALQQRAEVPAWHQDRLAPKLPPLLVLFAGWDSFFPGRCDGNRVEMAERLNRQLQHELLPAFLESQRWFAAKKRIDSVRVATDVIWRDDSDGQRSWLLLWLDVAVTGGEPQRYFLPLAMASEDQIDEAHTGAVTLARFRQQARVGALYDAFYDPRFCRALLRRLADGGGDLALGADGAVRLAFRPTGAFAELAGRDWPQVPVRRPAATGSNTAVLIGERLFLKAYRRLQAGINPEVELGRYLTDAGSYRSIARLAGSIDGSVGGDAEPTTLVSVQAYTPNQGDAWGYTLDYLARELEAFLTGAGDAGGDGGGPHGLYLMLATTLGRRTGELHRAFADSDDPGIAAEPVDAAEVDAWRRQIDDEAGQTFERLRQAVPTLADSEPTATATATATLSADASPVRLAQRLLTAEAALRARLRPGRGEPASDADVIKTRYHGDYHLGQVLVAENDVILIDFEGEPARPPAQRRRKHSPLKDVAGMLRSFDYAAHSARIDAHERWPEHDARIDAFIDDWRERAGEAFLAGYREAVEAASARLWSPASGPALLALFVLEKALYELRYELDNRPDWVGVPLNGLLALAGGDDA